MSKTTHCSLTSGRLLARNAFWNFIGQVAPLTVAILVIPILITRLGTDRFGVLTLAWVVLGYFSLFDLGLGRAMTKLVADRLGAGQEDKITSVVWTTLLLMVLLGLMGTLVATIVSPLLVRDILNIPETLQSESLHAFYMLACAIPLIITTTGLRGVLEAHQRFGLINAVRIPMGTFTFVGPLLVLPFSVNIMVVVSTLIVAQLLSLLLYCLLILRVMPALRRTITLQREILGTLFRLGTWMTLSNVVSPLMTHLDRFLIGGMLSMSAVAYYTTPFTVVNKLLVIPGAVVGVLFPAFAMSLSRGHGHPALLFTRGTKYIFLALFPITLVIMTFAPEALHVWLGSEFAKNSISVLKWLSIGLLFNGLSHVPFAFVQSAGRPDLTAKLHLAELPFYLLAAWWLIGTRGIEGAAIAWVLRVFVDMIFLFIMANHLLPIDPSMMRRMVFCMVIALLSLLLASVFVSPLSKALFFLLTIGGFILFGWCLILDIDERIIIQKIFRRANLSIGLRR